MFDILIIGGGVSGMTAALYSLRNGKKVLLIEGESIGGQAAQSPKVENFPTIKQTAGSKLSDDLFEQISDLGVEFEFDKIDKITKLDDDTFESVGEFGTYQSKAVIIANGVKPRKLGIAREDDFLGKGIYYCAICDGPFFEGKEVTLIGDGNTALQYSLLLANICKKVNLVIMFDKFFGEAGLVKKVESVDNIQVTKNSKAIEILGDNEFKGIKFQKNTGEPFEIISDGLFVAIGQIPDNKRFENVADIDSNGYFDADETTKTKTPGLFVAGDTRKKGVRQITTAVADGAVAGTGACLYLQSI